MNKTYSIVPFAYGKAMEGLCTMGLLETEYMKLIANGKLTDNCNDDCNQNELVFFIDSWPELEHD